MIKSLGFLVLVTIANPVAAAEQGSAQAIREPLNAEQPPFVGKWGTGKHACDASAYFFRKSDRLVVFGAGTAQYIRGFSLGHTCLNAKIGATGGRLGFSSACQGGESLDRRKGITDQDGEMKLVVDGEKLTGTGPDGHRLKLVRCR
ncbi:MAG: hypothetical protein ACT4N2_13325 [Hyphomicrobium sp.]